jgi:hypothetical protein
MQRAWKVSSISAVRYSTFFLFLFSKIFNYMLKWRIN